MAIEATCRSIGFSDLACQNYATPVAITLAACTAIAAINKCLVNRTQTDLASKQKTLTLVVLDTFDKHNSPTKGTLKLKDGIYVIENASRFRDFSIPHLLLRANGKEIQYPQNKRNLSPVFNRLKIKFKTGNVETPLSKPLPERVQRAFFELMNSGESPDFDCSKFVSIALDRREAVFKLRHLYKYPNLGQIIHQQDLNTGDVFSIQRDQGFTKHYAIYLEMGWCASKYGTSWFVFSQLQEMMEYYDCNTVVKITPEDLD